MSDDYNELLFEVYSFNVNDFTKLDNFNSEFSFEKINKLPKMNYTFIFSRKLEDIELNLIKMYLKQELNDYDPNVNSDITTEEIKDLILKNVYKIIRNFKNVTCNDFDVLEVDLL